MSNEWGKKWEVRKTTAGKLVTYITSQACDGSYGCSCKAWTLQRKECKHIKMVQGSIPVSKDYEVELIWRNTKPSRDIDFGDDWSGEGLSKKLARQISRMTSSQKSQEPERPTILELIKLNAPYGGI